MLISQVAYTVVTDKTLVAVMLLLSVTFKVMEVGPPAVVGVPEIRPLELRVKPDGNEPAITVQL
jgi:hypothetical protein